MIEFTLPPRNLREPSKQPVTADPRPVNAAGMIGGLIGAVLSLATLVAGGYMSALASGDGMKGKLIVILVMIFGSSACGLICGIRGMNLGLKGRSAVVPIVWSFASALLAAFGVVSFAFAA